MSNCDLVAARSLIDLVASRLALRAPALRAATALTRPNRSARWLPCGRHNVPTARLVGPSHVVTNHRVEHGDHLAHDRNNRDFVQLISGLETIVEHLKHRIPIARTHSGQVKDVTNWGTTTPYAAFSLELAALKGIGRDSDERSDLFAAHAAEFGQERDQGAGQHQSDPRHGSEQSIPMCERGIASHDLDQASVQHVDISREPGDTATRKPPHPSRVPDLLTPDHVRLDPLIAANTYHDSFGNFCHVIRAPAGRLTMSTDFWVQDKGEPDAIAPQAKQHALEDLPVEVLIFLLGSRYCETDRLSNAAWSLFGKVSKGWPLVKAICDYVHNHITFGYQHASPTKTAWDTYTERRGVCRDFAHLAITLCRCMNVPARYCTGYLGDIGVPFDGSPMDLAPGSKSISVAAGKLSMLATTSRASAAS
jgi:Transglutaminase-like superfamily